MAPARKPNRYVQLIEKIFHAHYSTGDQAVDFERAEIISTATELNIPLPKNLGDLIYTFRYRVTLPESIKKLETREKEWIIRPVGRAKYRFALVPRWNLVPNPNWTAIKIPNATPGMIERYAFTDEQSLLAKLRYNRLIDIFSGVTCYSLQNHLRTTVATMGQVETDEIYVGVDRFGVHYVIPVQAKGGNDKLSVVQIEQDIALAAEKFPGLVCRAIGAQFMDGGVIALYEFDSSDQGITVRSEKHYTLVAHEELTAEDFATYRKSQSELT